MNNFWQYLAVFWPLGYVYGQLASFKQNLSLKKQTKLPVPVLSVGNISVGGTGKTPLVLYLAQNLAQKYCTVILTRGYRAKPPGYPFLIQPNSVPLDPKICGDEPLLLAKESQAKVIIDPDRLRGADFALKQVNAEVLILEDGFGQTRIKKNLDLVLFSLRDICLWNRPLPAGPWRESASSLSRADLFLINLEGKDKTFWQKKVQTKLAGFNKPVLFFNYLPYTLISSQDRTPLLRKPQKYGLITSLANSQRLVHLLANFLGKPPIVHLAYPDHYHFEDKDKQKIMALSQQKIPLLCTLKEVDKLTKLLPEQEFFIIKSQIVFSSKQEEDFFWQIIGEIIYEEKNTSQRRS